MIVTISFPMPVDIAEVTWELHGDVLEVEYLGRAFTYYEAFLVPTGAQPIVEHEEDALSFRFPKSGER